MVVTSIIVAKSLPLGWILGVNWKELTFCAGHDLCKAARSLRRESDAEASGRDARDRKRAPHGRSEARRHTKERLIWIDFECSKDDQQYLLMLATDHCRVDREYTGTSLVLLLIKIAAIVPVWRLSEQILERGMHICRSWSIHLCRNSVQIIHVLKDTIFDVWSHCCWEILFPLFSLVVINLKIY